MTLQFYVEILLLWFGVWSVYNFVLKQKRITDRGQILLAFFFGAAAMESYLIYKNLLPDAGQTFAFVFLLLFMIALVLRFYSLKFKFILKLESKKTFFLMHILFNVLFQQIILNALLAFLGKSFSFTETILISTLFWGGIHSPLLLMKEASLRWIYLLMAFILAFISGYLILSLSAGFIYSFVIHFGCYILLSLLIPDERLI